MAVVWWRWTCEPPLKLVTFQQKYACHLLLALVGALVLFSPPILHNFLHYLFIYFLLKNRVFFFIW